MIQVSFINEDALVKRHLQKCSICEDEYFKHELIQCSKCNKFYCGKCIYMAGKLGNVCTDCFKSLNSHEKEQILERAAKLQFWANKGYVLFWILLGFTIVSFSLVIINPLFLLLGIGMVILSIFYGSRLYNFLAQ